MTRRRFVSWLGAIAAAFGFGRKISEPAPPVAYQPPDFPAGEKVKFVPTNISHGTWDPRSVGTEDDWLSPNVAPYRILVRDESTAAQRAEQYRIEPFKPRMVEIDEQALAECVQRDTKDMFRNYVTVHPAALGPLPNRVTRQKVPAERVIVMLKDA